MRFCIKVSVHAFQRVVGVWGETPKVFSGGKMKYSKIKKAAFVDRPNRFVAHVTVDGKEETVHVKNTGRCKELLTPNATVILEESSNPNRKTKYSLIAVYKGDKLINMDSQSPNAAAFEAIESGIIKEIGKCDYIKREVKYSNSRFDIYYEKGETKGFIEVKGVTLEQDGMTFFPDAPTERGRKHIYELIKAKNEGYEASILFVIQMNGVKSFSPNTKTDPKFAQALMEARNCGVNILAYDCIITENEMITDSPVDVIL